MIYFSKTNKGFYNSKVHLESQIPNDAQEISEQDYQILIDGQSQGMLIDFDVTGNPQLVHPNSLISLTEAKEKRKSFINSERTRILSQGMMFNNVLYDCDEEAKTNITGVVVAVVAGIPLPENFTWRSKDNKDIPMIEADVLALGTAIFNYRNAVLQRSWALKDLIDKKLNKNTVSKIDWNTEV